MPHSEPPAGDPDSAARLNPLTRLALTRPAAVIVAGLLLVVIAGFGIGRLQIRTDGESLVPLDDARVRYGRETSDRFGLRDQLIVLLRHGEDVFNAATLEQIARLTAAIQALSEIAPDDVTSLATERGDRVVPGTLTVRTFLSPLPRTPEEIEVLREDVRRIGLFHGTLVSRDERSAAIYVGVRDGVDRADVDRRIRAIIDGTLDDASAARTGVVGGAAAETLLGAHIMDDLGVPRRFTGRDFARGGRGDDVSTISAIRTLVADTVGLLPVAIGVMTVVLLLFFRRLLAVLLTMSEVVACLVFVFGLMGFAGVPVYLTVAVMPIILTAVGIADEIHIFHRYRAIVHREGRPADRRARRSLVEATMREMTRPVVQTSITTAIGFLSFATSPVGAVRAFGVFTAAGVLFCMLWSLAVVPACFVVLPATRLVAARAWTVHGPPIGDRIAAVMLRGRVAIVVIAVAAALLAPLAVSRITVQDSWLDGFARDSAFARDTDAFNAGFLGSHLLHVTVDTGGRAVLGDVPASALAADRVTLPPEVAARVTDPAALAGAWIAMRPVTSGGTGPPALSLVARIGRATRDGDRVVVYTDRGAAPSFAVRHDAETVRVAVGPRRLADPEVLAALCGLEAFVAGRTGEAVGGVLGPCAYLEATNYLLAGRREAYRAIPADLDRANLVWRHFARVRGEVRRRNLVDEGLDRAIVTAYLTEANFADTRRLLDAIRGYEAEHLAPLGLSLDFAGDVAESQSLIEAIVRTQVRSLLLSLAGILLVTTLLGRSIAWGLCCVLPCAGAVLAGFAAMGILGVPLGVATSMFAGMVLGIGVDYAIHLMERFRLALRAGAGRHAAIREAFTVTGPAVLVDALAIAIGFGTLCLSQVPANNRLGALLALSVVACFVGTLVLLPAVLAMFGGRAARG